MKVPRKIKIIICTVLVLAMTATFIPAIPSQRTMAAESPADNYLDMAAQSFADFVEYFYDEDNNGNAFFTGDYQGMEWYWHVAELFGLILDNYERTGDPQTEQMIYDYYDSIVARVGTLWTDNQFNYAEMISYMIINVARAWQLTGDERFEGLAREKFDDLYARWVDQDAETMYRVPATATDGENMIGTANLAGASIAAYMVYLEEEEEDYLNKAIELFGWLRDSVLFNENTGAVYNSVDYAKTSGVFIAPGSTGTLRDSIFTYNAGLFISAATFLYKATDDDDYFDDAQKAMDYMINSSGFFPGGIISGGSSYHGIFFRWAARFVHEADPGEAYVNWLVNNALAVWDKRDDDTGLIGRNMTAGLAPSDLGAAFNTYHGVVLMQVFSQRVVVDDPYLFMPTQSFADFVEYFYDEDNNGNAFFTGDYQGPEWYWHVAELFGLILDNYERTGDPQTEQMIYDYYDSFVARVGALWTNNQFNYAEMVSYMIINVARAWQLTGDERFEGLAREKFDDLYARWVDQDAETMYRVPATAADSDNMIATAALAGASMSAYMVYQEEGEPAYLDKAIELFSWLRQSNLFNKDTGAVYNGINFPKSSGEFITPGSTGTLVDSILTYNAGMFAAAATFLYNATDNEDYFDDAQKAMDYMINSSGFFPGGIISGGSGYHGIFFRWAARFVHEADPGEAYVNWLVNNALAVWDKRDADTGLFGRNMMGGLAQSDLGAAFNTYHGVVLMQVFSRSAIHDDNILDEVIISVDRTDINMNQTAELSIAAYMRDGSEADLSNAVIRFRYSPERIVGVNRFDGTVIQLVSDGVTDSVEVEVSVTLNGYSVNSNTITFSIDSALPTEPADLIYNSLNRIFLVYNDGLPYYLNNSSVGGGRLGFWHGFEMWKLTMEAYERNP